MKVLALDQSTMKTGIAVFDDGELTFHSIIDLKQEKVPEVRFQEMCKRLNSMILKTTPDVVVFEDVSFQTNPSTLIILARVQGAIIQSALFNNIPFMCYKPSSWRKLNSFRQGKDVTRKELKQQALNYVKRKYNLNVREDVAEAICIGTAFLIDLKSKGDIING